MRKLSSKRGNAVTDFGRTGSTPDKMEPTRIGSREKRQSLQAGQCFLKDILRVFILKICSQGLFAVTE